MIGFGTLEPINDFYGRVARRVYHVFLRQEAFPLLGIDNTSATLAMRIGHIARDRVLYDFNIERTTRTEWWSKQKRIGLRPSQYYDQVATMVKREFPALAPYVIEKRATAKTYEKINTKPPFPTGAVAHIALLELRKPFKFSVWALRNRRENG